MENCYCGSLKKYSECCEPFINNEEVPDTPEKLMRSRYSAFCQKNMDYIFETWDPQSLDQVDKAANIEWATQAVFLGLEVIKSEQDKNKGIVEFKVRYKLGDQEHVHHEISKFRKQSGIWYFKDGRDVTEPTK